MSGRRESQFRKLKKKRIGLSLFMIIFVTVIAHLLLAGFVVTFFYHLLIQKVEGEYEHVGHMARLYENVSDGSESVSSYYTYNISFIHKHICDKYRIWQ